MACPADTAHVPSRRYLRLRRARRRWSTPFARWLDGVGVRTVAGTLNVRVQSVYEWLAGRTSPDFDKRRALVRLSEGRLTSETIDRHREEVTRT